MATKLLPQQEIDDAMLTLNEWLLEDNDVGQLTKEFQFNSFEETMEFVNKVKEVANEKNYFPDILIHTQGKQLELMITDYEYEGITQECLDLAFAIDGIE